MVGTALIVGGFVVFAQTLGRPLAPYVWMGLALAAAWTALTVLRRHRAP